MFYLILLLLLVGVILTVLLAAWTLWFQGYIYSEPVQNIEWRAPAAGTAVMLFLTIWAFLAYGSGDTTRQGRYRTLFEFSSTQELPSFPEIRIEAVNGAGAYRRIYEQGKQVYRLNGNGPYPPSRPDKVFVRENDEEIVFEPERDAKGTFLSPYYRDKNGRTMQDGYLGQVSIHRSSWLMLNFVLNLLHLGVWFIVIWLLLQFQWPHALLQAVGIWLVMTLFVVPGILNQAEVAAEAAVAAKAQQ